MRSEDAGARGSLGGGLGAVSGLGGWSQGLKVTIYKTYSPVQKKGAKILCKIRKSAVAL